MKRKIFNKRKMEIGLVAGLLFIWALNVPVTKSADSTQTSTNLIAAHDSSSPKYNRNCTNCHSNILTEKSLTSTKNAHVAMLPNTPGKDNKKCIWCHRTVNLVQGTAPVGNPDGNLRKRVNTQLCAVCHGPSGPNNPVIKIKQFYQEISPALTGAELYELVCAACHRSLSNSQVKGESASEIREKINKNEGGMGPLRALSPQQIQAIANALAQ